MRNPQIIIGSETEYGILFVTEDGRVQGENNRETNRHFVRSAIEYMLNEGISITGGLCRDTDSFESTEEHNKTEEMVRLERLGLVDTRRKRAGNGYAQRRGFTGSFLANGARFYEDMLHPEYSCPECTDPYTAMCVQKAGDFIAEQSALRAKSRFSEHVGQPATVHIIKNNSDGQGKSYAGHENYLVSRPLFQTLRTRSPQSDLITLFFVTRQIITGAGKIGAEHRVHVPYQISQRADFFSQRFSENTTSERGIINRRDISYVEDQKWGRFHVIVGDSNRSDLSLFLKHGMTALVLMMLEADFLRGRFPWWDTALVRPVHALQQVSRDLTLSKKIVLLDRRRATALQVMSAFAACADAFVTMKDLSPVWRDVVTYWKGVLEGLSEDRHRHPLSRSLDWVVMERALMIREKKTGESFDSPTSRSMELSYRTLGEDSYYNTLVARGQIMTLAKEEDVQRLIYSAPKDTRAWFRSEIIKRYERHVMHMRWDFIELSHSIGWDTALPQEMFSLRGGTIHMPDPFWGGEASAKALLENDPQYEVFLQRAQEMSGEHMYARVHTHLFNQNEKEEDSDA